ncbi:alpha/beta hydrolase fold domain-containing protein [Kitasatospora sp. NPDC052896]|uniref:alpha/beta hydrolase fold domain-containing protein n=1 Tax=Kitasatospora sp. NPDC052896 TaxID=3364061 RepID=UPI0037CA91F5
MSGASTTGRAALDPALTAEALRTRARDHLRERDRATPPAGPVSADLTGLPPLFVQVCSHEILLGDAVRLPSRAADHDVPVELQVWPVEEQPLPSRPTRRVLTTVHITRALRRHPRRTGRSGRRRAGSRV